MTVPRQPAFSGQRSAPCAGALISLGLVFLALAVPARAVTAPEYELKATFLFNFITFTGWPTAVMPPAGQPLVIGVLGEDPFGPALDHIVENESVQGHPIVVQRFRQREDVAGCHVLYISRSESANLPALFKQLHDQPVLTVSDLDRFAYTGGMIGLVVEQGHVRVQINLDSATASRLVLGAKLLRIARVIREAPQSLLFPSPSSLNPQMLAVLPVRLALRRRTVV